jgi:hypothetical protein
VAQRGPQGYLQYSTNSRIPLNITNAFIVWALSASGINNLQIEYTALEVIADASISSGKADSYFLAVLTSALFKLGQSVKANVYAK